MKALFLELNKAYLFFGATMYMGVLWSLRFFWFPTWTTLKVENYYDQFIPQTDAATKFFTVVVPIMFLSHIIMVVSEWKTRMRWASIIALLCLVISTYVGYLKIIPINKILKTHITDQARVTELLQQWMKLNDIRFVFMTLAWATLMYYYASKSYRATKAGVA